MKIKLMKYGIAFVIAIAVVVIVGLICWGAMKLHPLSVLIFPVILGAYFIAQAIEIDEVKK